jgi:hypothetical protein
VAWAEVVHGYGGGGAPAALALSWMAGGAPAVAAQKGVGPPTAAVLKGWAGPPAAAAQKGRAGVSCSNSASGALLRCRLGSGVVCFFFMTGVLVWRMWNYVQG